LKLLNRALDSIEISENGLLSVMMLTQDMLKKTRARIEDTDGFLNYAKNIKDIKVAALIHQQPNGPQQEKTDKTVYHVSLRSDGSVDVASIASEFGGGGHRTAAGFCVESTLTEIKAKILDLAKTI
jgi:phosphoesterase RecJ-like protein